jgi:hypothetical protein
MRIEAERTFYLAGLNWIAGFATRVLPPDDGRDAFLVTLLALPSQYTISIITQAFYHHQSETEAAWRAGWKTLVIHALKMLLAALVDTIAHTGQLAVFLTVVWTTTYLLWPGKVVNSGSQAPVNNILESPLLWVSVAITGLAFPIFSAVSSFVYNRALTHLLFRKSTEGFKTAAKPDPRAVKMSQVVPLFSKNPGKESETPTFKVSGSQILAVSVEPKEPAGGDKDIIDYDEADRADEELVSEFLGVAAESPQPVSAGESVFYSAMIAQHNLRRQLRRMQPGLDKDDLMLADARVQEILHGHDIDDPLRHLSIPGNVASALAEKMHVTTHSSYAAASISSAFSLVSIFLIVVQPDPDSFWYVLLLYLLIEHA